MARATNPGRSQKGKGNAYRIHQTLRSQRYRYRPQPLKGTPKSAPVACPPPAAARRLPPPLPRQLPGAQPRVEALRALVNRSTAGETFSDPYRYPFRSVWTLRKRHDIRSRSCGDSDINPQKDGMTPYRMGQIEALNSIHNACTAEADCFARMSRRSSSSRLQLDNSSDIRQHWPNSMTSRTEHIRFDKHFVSVRVLEATDQRAQKHLRLTGSNL